MKMDYTLSPSNVDRTAPLIYMWEIYDLLGQIVGRYIGKANGGDQRPTKHYARNVDRLMQKLPYRSGKNYRRVHYALSDAVRAGHSICLTYLCNVPDTVDIFKVEARYIKEYGCAAVGGIGLNGMRREATLDVPTIATVLRSEAQADAHSDSLDLDDFLEYFDDKPREAFDVRVNTKSCSVWSSGRRLLRAKQTKPGAKVLVKLVQTSEMGELVEFPWDGTDDQIGAALKAERKLLLASGEAPLF